MWWHSWGHQCPLQVKIFQYFIYYYVKHEYKRSVAMISMDTLNMFLCKFEMRSRFIQYIRQHQFNQWSHQVEARKRLSCFKLEFLCLNPCKCSLWYIVFVPLFFPWPGIESNNILQLSLPILFSSTGIHKFIFIQMKI